MTLGSEAAELRGEGLLRPGDPLVLQAALLAYACSFTSVVTGAQVRQQWMSGGEEDERAGTLVLVQAALGAVSHHPALQALRSTAAKVFVASPELGRELIEQIASLDAALQGQG